MAQKRVRRLAVTSDSTTTLATATFDIVQNRWLINRRWEDAVELNRHDVKGGGGKGCCAVTGSQPSRRTVLRHG